MLKPTKWIALSLTTVTALSILAGCGGKPGAAGTAGPAPKAGNLQYLTWDETQVPVIKDQLKSFTGAKVTVNTMPYDDYWTKLQTAIAGGSGPDLYWMTRPNYDIWSRLGAAGN
ncbi:MAG: transporter substrate-binding protein, partial [Firmicutes bacterium]|nr:transporter substrate-binding protein [Bacillota bacterium]